MTEEQIALVMKIRGGDRQDAIEQIEWVAKKMEFKFGGWQSWDHFVKNSEKKGKCMSKVFVGFLLDRTGSMAKIKGDTIGGFNEYKRTLGDNSDGLEVEAYMSLFQFNSNAFDTLTSQTPIAQVPDLTEQNFNPSGWTNLVDSLHRTIKEIETSQLSQVPDMKVIISILTDGEENASQYVTKAQLAELITEKQAAGWAFNFMGAGFDVYKDSVSKMVGLNNTMSYAAGDTASTTAAFTSTASNSRRFAKGLVGDLAYDKDQRTRSGDTFRKV